MSGFNAKRLGSYGQTNYVVGMGRNRCAVGSITREYNYLERTSKNPFCSLFDFGCPNNPVPPPAPRVPSAPIIVSTTPLDTIIDIYFTQPSNGGSPITNYEYLFVDVSGASWTPFSPPVTTSPVTLTALTPGQTYYIQIRAVNSVGSGSASATVTETTLTVPEQPTDLSAIPGDSSIEISFTQPYDGGSPITNYEYSLDGGSSWSPFSPSDTTSSVTITGLTNGTVYNIKLRAINTFGNGLASSQISIAPIPSNSFAPADISGINLWLDGQYSSSVIVDVSSNLVTTWDDRSGANNNFSSTPSGTITYSQPSGINNRPAIYFETAPSTYLSSSFNIAPTSNELSLFMVVYPVSNVPGNSELFFAINGPTSPGYAYFDLFNNTNSTGLLTVNIGSPSQVSTGLDIRGDITLIDVIATGTADVYVNGTQTNNNITRGPLSLDNIIEWAISGGAFQGYVGEIIAYPSGLSDNNRQKVEGYLAWKWGIQEQLPNNQPYKNAPPISLDAPIITGITGTPQSLSVDFTQTTGGLTITNYQYSTDNGDTFRELATPDITSPLTITTLSSDGITPLTNGVTYDVIIQAKTANGLSPLSNMVQGAPDAPAPGAPTIIYSLPGDTEAYIYFTKGSGNITNYEYSIDTEVTWNTLTIANINAPTPVVITGLTNGIIYNVNLRALNTSTPSVASNTISVTPQAGSSSTESLYYDPSNNTSYPGSGTTVSNIGNFGSFNGTLIGINFVVGTGITRSVFDFSGASRIAFGQYNFGASFTVSAWVYPRNKFSINGLIANTTANQQPNGFKFGWNNWNANNRTMLFEAGNGTQGGADASLENIVEYDSWQYLTYVLDVTNRIALFIRNGVPVNSASYSDNITVENIGTNNPNFNIGAFIGNSYTMNAQLGYIKIYNGVLSLGDIQNDYNNSKTSFGL